MGTFFLVLVAVGGSATASLTADVSHATSVVALALLMMAMILAFGGIYGAHLDPMATLAFCIRRDLPARRVPGYIAAQLLGAIVFPKVASMVSTAFCGEIPAASAASLRSFAVMFRGSA